ncbi:MAG TPA: SRPBCC domain-containing protein [Actinomycetes bacterium]|nr:SRPBCC domain-containing protein [Actinomycetes bacterium]
MSAIAPIRRQVVVPVSSDRAFAAWTEQLHAWWPFARHSVYGEEATAAFVDGKLIETAPDGTSCSWGTVTTWEPGRRVTMTWHPGQSEDAATTVDVQFDEIADRQTLVTLTHSGWESRADSLEARADYRNGWATVVGLYAASFSPSGEAESEHEPSWLVLQHYVAPDVEGSPFASPLFAEHTAFLARASERDWLVAAGNLPDSPGSGMTILRVPRANVSEAVAAAQDDDQSVAKGLFDVHVRPWNVALSR